MNGMDEWQAKENERLQQPPHPDSIAAKDAEIERLRAKNVELSRMAMLEALANARLDEANEELRSQLVEWQQAASVEAGLRREFLARAEKAEVERDAALKQLVKYRLALEPFARFADRFGDHARDDSWQLTSNPSGKGNLIMGDVRQARAVLTDDQQKEPGYTQYTSFRP